ncbi:MAG: hypothetical protein CMB96_04665 [Flavobacteriaceae bacterium]|nr:hypothetical protein [Flavobacteriaceae bacterium]
MVKNHGGNKSKKGARKHLNPTSSRAVREKVEEGEIYAAVMKLYGGANCEVICEDGHKRLCIIRNKFRGRGKRDNFIGPGVWVLVGLREWEARTGDKQEKCDLLCVYREDEKKKLKSNASGNWAALAAADPDTSSKLEEEGEIGFDFEEGNEVNETLVKSLEETLAVGDSTNKTGGSVAQWEDVIDIDDI